MNEDEDVTMNRSPKGGATHARIKELQDKQDSLQAPEPEVDTQVTSVPRSEMMSPVPKESKGAKPWAPVARKKPKSIE